MTFKAVESDRDFFAFVLESDTVRVKAKLNPLGLKDLLDNERDVFILVGDESRHTFDDGYLSPEASVHLSELKPDIAASHDDEMFGRLVKVEDGCAGKKRDLSNAGHIRNSGPRTDVKKDIFCVKNLVANANLVGRLEARSPCKDRASLHAAQPIFNAGARLHYDRVLASQYLFHIDDDRLFADYSEVAAATCDVGCVCTCDHCLSWGASDIHAGSAEQLALDHGDRPAGLCETARQRRSSLPCTDNDCVEVLSHLNLMTTLARMIAIAT